MGKITKGAALPAQREQIARIAYRDARATFELWAGIDAPSLPDDATDAAQVGLARWQENRFGHVPTSDPIMALGVLEELSETFDSDDDPESAVDGLGDTCVYAAQLCTRNRLAVRPVIALAEIYAKTNSGAGQLTPLHAAGNLAHVVVKHEQMIRGLGPADVFGPRLVDALALIICKAYEYATIAHNLEISSIAGVLHVIAREVMQRKQGDAMIPAPITIDATIGAETTVHSEERKAAALEQLARGADLAAASAAAEPGDFDVSDVVNHAGICPHCAAPMSQRDGKPVLACTNGHEFTRGQIIDLAATQHRMP